MNDDQAEQVMHEVMDLAILLRDEAGESIRAACDRVMKAAGGDHVAALVIASALIDVDLPPNPWWLASREGRPVRTLQPCGTYAAHRRHERNGEPIDAACEAANSAWRARNRRMKQNETRTGRGVPLWV